MAHVEFFFDLSSPWTRLAFHNIQPIVRETGATITWRPFLVGGVFNAVNASVYAGRAKPDSPKNRNTFKWLQDWARLTGVTMNFPSRHHPLKSVRAMRFCCALEDDQTTLFRFAEAAFEAYFGETKNLDEGQVLADIADACGLDGQGLLRRIQDEDIKQRLRDNTQEVIDRGGFGSPTLFVNATDMYFGNDQLPIVRLAMS
jgi:2-hydroxychromene-2-carboxylate isomerase